MGTPASLNLKTEIPCFLTKSKSVLADAVAQRDVADIPFKLKELILQPQAQVKNYLKTIDSTQQATQSTFSNVFQGCPWERGVRIRVLLKLSFQMWIRSHPPLASQNSAGPLAEHEYKQETINFYLNNKKSPGTFHFVCSSSTWAPSWPFVLPSAFNSPPPDTPCWCPLPCLFATASTFSLSVSGLECPEGHVTSCLVC